MRYARHIVLKEIGGSGQQALSAARVAIIGLGGLGNAIAQYLVAAGIGTLGLIDDDTISLDNLQRQVLFDEADIGAAKTQIAAQKLAAQNSDCRLITHECRLTADNAALLADYDIIADASDNFTTRFLLGDTCARLKKVLVSGAISRFDGQIATYKPWARDGHGAPLPDYRAFVPENALEDALEQEQGQDCATLGVVGALGGIIGSLQALEIIKEITGAGDSLAGFVLIYDGLRGDMRRVKLHAEQ